ncbi:MAG TPA: hypothetical protein VM938_09185 [Acidimicrobiales bacterium]|nr:hypothetical protein [Acidimicrobiales bacterium]
MRRAAVFPVTLLAASLLISAPPAAMAAETGSCNGHGVLHTASPIRVDALVSTVYFFNVQGVCMFGYPFNTVFRNSFSGQGVLTGRCASWSGHGEVHGDHEHDHELVGTTWFVGDPLSEAFGQFQIVPDSSAGQSCLTGVTRWLIVGGVELS